MAEEEKGFIIKDKRSFDEKGDLKNEKPQEEEKKVKEEMEKQAPEDEAESPPPCRRSILPPWFLASVPLHSFIVARLRTPRLVKGTKTCLLQSMLSIPSQC